MSSLPGFKDPVSASIVTIGVLFKIMHWPGAFYFLIGGVGLYIIGLIISLVRKK